MKKPILSGHIIIFDKYGGNPDGFARCATDHEKEIFNGGEWSIIEDIFQDLKLINSGATSQRFRDDFEMKIANQMDEDAVKLIKRIST